MAHSDGTRQRVQSASGGGVVEYQIAEHVPEHCVKRRIRSESDMVRL